MIDKPISQSLVDDISNGVSFSAALGRRPEVFPDIFISIVRAGEASGVLESGLGRAASYFATKDELRKKIIGSLTYPALVLVLSLFSMVFVGVYLIPMMSGVFSSLGLEMPFLTRAIGRIGSVFLDYWYILILILIVTVYLAGRRAWNLLNIPIIGPVTRMVVLQRVSETLAALLGAGVSLVPALSITSASSGSVVYKKKIDEAIESIQNGQKLSCALKDSSLFPPAYCEMVNVGESSGRLKEVFEDLSGYYGRDVEAKIKSAVSLVEPASTVLVGAVVGLIVFSMFLPIVGMLDKLAK